MLDGVILGQGSFGRVVRCFSAHSGDVGVAHFAAKEIKYGALKASEVP